MFCRYVPFCLSLFCKRALKIPGIPGILLYTRYTIAKPKPDNLSYCPANICWSSRRLQDMPWICLQYVVNVTIFRLQMSWRHVLKMSAKPFGGKQNVYWSYLYLTNQDMYLRNLYFTNLYLTNLRWIQNALVRTQ